MRRHGLFLRDRRALTRVPRANSLLTGRKRLHPPPPPAEMDAPKGATNSPGWVYKSAGGQFKALASAAQDGELLLLGRGE